MLKHISWYSVNHLRDSKIPVEELIEVPLIRRSQRETKLTLSKGYIVYLNESNYHIGQVNDHKSFDETISSEENNKMGYCNGRRIVINTT